MSEFIRKLYFFILKKMETKKTKLHHHRISVLYPIELLPNKEKIFNNFGVEFSNFREIECIL